MKTDQELDKIAEDITEKAKINMRAQISLEGLSDTLKVTRYGAVLKDSMQYITEMINAEHLEPDEEIKVAKKIRRLFFFSARRERKWRRKKVKDGAEE